MDRYWRSMVENNLLHINKELERTLTTPETEEDAKRLYLRWLHSLSLRGEDL